MAFSSQPLSPAPQESPLNPTTVWEDIWELMQYFRRRLSGPYSSVKRLEKHLLMLGAVDMRKEQVSTLKALQACKYLGTILLHPMLLPRLPLPLAPAGAGRHKHVQVGGECYAYEACAATNLTVLNKAAC